VSIGKYATGHFQSAITALKTALARDVRLLRERIVDIALEVWRFSMSRLGRAVSLIDSL
jgi:hypothetical protein